MGLIERIILRFGRFAFQSDPAPADPAFVDHADVKRIYGIRLADTIGTTAILHVTTGRPAPLSTHPMVSVASGHSWDLSYGGRIIQTLRDGAGEIGCGRP